MHWLLLLLAIGALAVALFTPSVGLAAVCVLAALVLLVAWALGWYSTRVGSRSRDEMSMIDPMELRRLREQAEARKLASQSQAPGPTPPAA
jgi:multisubunit Na+/H+ antiporter MnhB subunit